MMMSRCRTCCYPQTKPDLYFDETGECSACVNARKKPLIDWDSRRAELATLLDRHDGRCIVPSSGGKDSLFQVLTLLDMGADVTAVTATTCHLTDIGRKNLDNLGRFVPTIEVSPNKTIRKKLNRLGFEMVGDSSWAEHASIFAVPFHVAQDMKIPLVLFGEAPQMEYGGPLGSDEAKKMTRRWVHEFAGLNGLRATDFVGMDGITDRDMKYYKLPADIESVEANFLGQFVGPWDSRKNAEFSIAHGLQYQLPCEAHWWEWENMDNFDAITHEHLGFRKYGFGRLCAQISVDIRNGLISRYDAMKIVIERDGIWPDEYMGIPISQAWERIDMTEKDFFAVMDKFTDFNLFEKIENNRLVLKEFSAT